MTFKTDGLTSSVPFDECCRRRANSKVRSSLLIKGRRISSALRHSSCPFSTLLPVCRFRNKINSISETRSCRVSPLKAPRLFCAKPSLPSAVLTAPRSVLSIMSPDLTPDSRRSHLSWNRWLAGSSRSAPGALRGGTDRRNILCGIKTPTMEMSVENKLKCLYRNKNSLPSNVLRDITMRSLLLRGRAIASARYSGRIATEADYGCLSGRYEKKPKYFTTPTTS